MMSREPSRSTVSANAASTASRSLTSRAILTPPISSATPAAAAASMSLTTTRAPAAARARAMPAPMPRPAPVTCAVLPLRSIQSDTRIASSSLRSKARIIETIRPDGGAGPPRAKTVELRKQTKRVRQCGRQPETPRYRQDTGKPHLPCEWGTRPAGTPTCREQHQNSGKELACGASLSAR